MDSVVVHNEFPLAEEKECYRYYECTKSLSVLNILGPIAEKIINLKQKKGAVCNAAEILGLLKQCKSLEMAAEYFKKNFVASLNDEKYKIEMEKSCSLIQKSVQGMIVATKNLHRGDIPIQTNEEAWTDLIESVENLLKGLVNALLAMDQAQLIQIDYALRQLQHSIQLFSTSKSQEDLFSCYQDVISTISDVYELVLNRSKDINRPLQVETLYSLIYQIHYTIPLLSATVISVLESPNSKTLKANCSLVVDRIFQLIESLKMETGLGSEVYNIQEAGSFIKSIDGLFEIVNGLEREVYNAKNFSIVSSIKSSLETVLRHVIGLSHCCHKDAYASIMAACESVLSQMKILSEMESKSSTDPIDFEVSLRILHDLLEILELKSNTSLIRLIVQNLAHPFSTLDLLLRQTKFIQSLNLESGDRDESIKEINGLVEKFEKEMDLLFQIGGFAIACTNDTQKARNIQSTLSSLEWLESCIVPAVLSVANDNNSHLMTNVINLAKQLIAEMVRFRHVIDLLMDPSAFVLITKQEIHLIFSELSEDAEKQTHSKDFWLKKIKKVILLARRTLVLDRTALYLEDSTRQKIQKALLELSKAEEKLNIVAEFRISEKKSLLKRVQLMLTIMSSLSSSLNVENFENFSFCDEVENEDHSVRKKYWDQPYNEPKSFNFVSRIEDVPVDLTVPTPKNSKLLQNAMKNNESENQSIARSINLTGRTIGLGRFHLDCNDRTNREKSKVNQSQNISLTDNSVDISKFLISRSTNAFRNSTRNSKRNYSLKLKEICIDIGDILKVKDNGADETRKGNTLNNDNDCSLENLTNLLSSAEKLTESFANFYSRKDDSNLEPLEDFSRIDASDYVSMPDMFDNGTDSRNKIHTILSSTGITEPRMSTIADESNEISSTPFISITHIEPDLLTSVIANMSTENEEVLTPSRLDDLKVVNKRLATLKALYK